MKPIDQIQLSIGKFDGGETGFRGDFCYGSWNWLRPFNWIADDEGLTFKGSHKDGLMARITPIDNLVVLVQLPVLNAKWGGNNNGYVAKTETEDAKNTAADVFKNAAYMASILSVLSLHIRNALIAPESGTWMQGMERNDFGRSSSS